VTWAVRDADHLPTAINGNVKAGFTALCSLTAAWTKFLLVMIASGKTQQVERNQFGDIEPYGRLHTISGWATVSSFQDYLVFLRSQLPGPEPLSNLGLFLSASWTADPRVGATNGNHLAIHPGGNDRLPPVSGSRSLCGNESDSKTPFSNARVEP
jgi:hypothetical protein